MRHGQSRRWRLAVFVAVVGVHVLAGWHLVATSSILIARGRAAAPLSLLWLQQEGPANPHVNSPAPFPDHSLKRRAASADIEPTPQVAEPEPSTAITLPLALSTDADSVARRQAQRGKRKTAEKSRRALGLTAGRRRISSRTCARNWIIARRGGPREERELETGSRPLGE
jgi:hypothetical protein